MKNRNGKISLSDMKFGWQEEVKEEYLETQKTTTAKTIKIILLKVDKYEQSVNKSVYDLNTEEVDDLMESKFPNKSKGVAGSNKSYIEGYVDFCISKNLVRHRENRFSLITSERLEGYVNTQAMNNKYLSQEEIREAQDKLANFCDKLLLELIPLSVRGRTQKGNTNEELVNLREKDVDFENRKLTVWNNDGEPREIYNLSDHTLYLLRKTMEQNIYKANNGKKITKNKNGTEFDQEKVFKLNKTGYVFRTAGKAKDGKVSAQHFRSRIDRIIKEHVGNSYINVTNLYFSGMIEYAKQLRQEKGLELDKLDYAKICDKFNYGEPILNKDTGVKEWGNVIFKIKKMVEDYLRVKGV